jgi:hypothetical protein
MLARLIREVEQAFGERVSLETVEDKWDPSRLNALFRSSATPDAPVFVQNADDFFWVLAEGWELNTEEYQISPDEHYELARDAVFRIGEFGVIGVRPRGWRRVYLPRIRLVVPSHEDEELALWSDARWTASYEVEPWTLVRGEGVT